MRYALIFLASAVCFLISGCTGINDPYYTNSDRYYDPPRYSYHGRDRYRDDYYRNQYERKQLEEERRELEKERARLERERKKAHHDHHRPAVKPRPPVVAKKPDRCPPGWQPGGKCSKKERKKGCQDMRTPGGLGCRRF